MGRGMMMGGGMMGNGMGGGMGGGMMMRDNRGAYAGTG